MPKRTIAIVLLVLAALASTLTYTGFLVVGVLATYLDLGRFAAGLLLAALFARFPWVREGRLRIVGLLPQPARRPLMVSLLVLSLSHFLWQGDYGHAAFTAFSTAFLLAFPWLRRHLVDRVRSSVFTFAGRNASDSPDPTVIDGEFRERKD